MSDDHYFAADPKTPFKRLPVSAHVWGESFELTSGAGVYSKGRLDIGTSVLFRQTEPPTGGDILDLGCGYGVIGLAIAALVPQARVTGVDVNERAVLLANENAASLGLDDRFAAARPGEIDADATYTEIWSNPPIRIGKEALHELLLQWFARLRPEGRAVMVVGKNLGGDSLQKWLTGQGYPTKRIGSSNGFRVLESTRAG